MHIEQIMVTQFMEAFHKRYFNKEDIDIKKELELCYNLIKQESNELLKAITKLKENTNKENDIEKLCNLIKEQCDLIYVILFLANFLGIPLKPNFQEVHIHNMGKTAGHEGPDGKWIKPPNYPSCNIEGVLERIGYIIK